MKKEFILVAILSLTSSMLFAQASDADKLKIDKPKIISKLDNLALSQITVNYMLTTTAKAVGQDKSSGSVAGAKISAYLQTNDGDLTEADFQEITDYFHVYFKRTLKANGIDTVAWNTISATEFYKNAAEKEDEGEKGKKDEKVEIFG